MHIELPMRLISPKSTSIALELEEKCSWRHVVSRKLRMAATLNYVYIRLCSDEATHFGWSKAVEAPTRIEKYHEDALRVRPLQCTRLLHLPEDGVAAIITDLSAVDV